MNLKRERILVLFTLVALVNCYSEHSNDYETESVSHIDLENEQEPEKVGVTEGTTKVKRFSVKDSQHIKRAVERHEGRKHMPVADRNWQVKPVKKVSKNAKKIHIYLNNDEPKAVKPKKQLKPEPADSMEQETQTKRTPELTTRADSDVRYFKFSDKDSLPAGSTHGKHSQNNKEADSAADSQVEGSEHYDHVKEKIKIKHHHHHHHHSHIKTVVKKEPYPVEKIVHVPVEKVVEKVVHVEKKVPYKVEVPVEKIVHVPFEKIVEKFVNVPYDRPYPVEKIVEKRVPYAVKEYVTVPVDRPYPVEKIVEKFIKVPTPYPVEKKVHVPQPYPVPVEKIVEKRIPYPVVKEVEVPRPYPVVQIKEVKVPYPVEKIVEKKIPHPYPVIKEVKVPVYIQSHQKHQSHNNQHEHNNQQHSNQHGHNHQQQNNQYGQHGQQNSGHFVHENQLNGQQLNSHYDTYVNHQNHQHQQNFDDSFFAGSKKYEKVQNSKQQQQPKGNHEYQTIQPNHQNQDTFRRTLKVPPKSQRPNPTENHPNTVTQSPQIKNVHTPLPQIIVGQQSKENNVEKPPQSFNVLNKLPADLQTPQTPVGFQTQQAQQEKKNTVSDNFYKFDHEYPSHTPKPQSDLITEGTTRYETYSQAPQPQQLVFVHSQPQFYSQMQHEYDHTQQAYIAQEMLHQEQQQMQFDERRHQFDQKRLQYEEALRQHEQQLRNHEHIQQGLGDPQYQIQYPINVQYAYQQEAIPVHENPSEQSFQPSYGVMQK